MDEHVVIDRLRSVNVWTNAEDGVVGVMVEQGSNLATVHVNSIQARELAAMLVCAAGELEKR